MWVRSGIVCGRESWSTNRWSRLSKDLGIRLVGNVWVGCSQHHMVQEGALGCLVGANTFDGTLAGTLHAKGNH
jgi:hypothetical protein